MEATKKFENNFFNILFVLDMNIAFYAVCP